MMYKYITPEYCNTVMYESREILLAPSEEEWCWEC